MHWTWFSSLVDCPQWKKGIFLNKITKFQNLNRFSIGSWLNYKFFIFRKYMQRRLARCFLKANSFVYCMANEIPRRRQAQRTCSLDRAKFCTLSLNKWKLFCEAFLTFGWSCGRLFPWQYVFPKSSKLPPGRQNVFKLATHLHTNTTCLMCGEGYDFHEYWLETWANRSQIRQRF